MRSKVRQAVRVADEKGLAFEWCEDPARLAEDLEGMYRLHAKRWEKAGEPGSFADERRRTFYGAFAPRLLENGTLRFARLVHEGEPVAYQLGALTGGAYYQIQEGFDPEREDLKIATALRALAVRALIDQGVASYDFMAGASRHKRDWGGLPRPCLTLAFPLPRLRARLEFAAKAFVERIRNR